MLRKRSPENIAGAVVMVQSGLTHREIAAHYGISQSTVRQWTDPAYYERSKQATQARQKRLPQAYRVSAKRWRATLSRDRLDAYNAKQRIRYYSNPIYRESLKSAQARHRTTLQGALAIKVRICTHGWSNRGFLICKAFMEAAAGETQEACRKRLTSESIDHIVPISAFDLTNPEHLVRCVYKDNIRSIPRKQNELKGYKHDCQDIMALPWSGNPEALALAAGVITGVASRLDRKAKAEGYQDLVAA